MKKLVTFMAGVSLALGSAALGQQPDATPKPGKTEKKEAAQSANAPGDAVSGKPSKQERKAAKAAAAQDANATGMSNSGNPGKPSKEQRKAAKAAAASQDGGQPVSGHETKHGRKAAKAAAAASASAVASPAGAAVAPNTNTQAVTKVKKLEPQKIEVIKNKYVTFQAQPRPDRVPTVTFNPGYRIAGAEQWQGPQYTVFRSYQPAMHDAAFYRSTYGRVENFGGGSYYWNNGYWYPAWGYDNSYSYYPYDGPIYVGRSALPPDRVIANVQAQLQEMGYYRGEVDGLLGPLTREALSAYQRENGLYATAVMDEPTLRSLGLG